MKESLSPPPIKSLENLSKLDQILNTKNSIFIHIRRGDYLSLSWQIDIEYYKKAVATIVNKIENPHFFLFCADREFAHNLDLGYPFIDMTSENISLDNHFEDLILMAHCQHGIVANSSYSWWAAYLIENPHKIIIAPTPWLHSNDEIICDDWIKIQAEKEVRL
nr:alpha-1,2-fucosyltransferase [Helicobacter japonicus]